LFIFLVVINYTILYMILNSGVGRGVDRDDR
jgi:hypothetical protein